jgi:cytochrome c
MRPSHAAIVRITAVIAIGALTLGLFARPVGAIDEVAGGQALYQSKCAGCHSVDADRIGPRHRNVIGRAVAGVAGYSYSLALKKLGGAWTPARLDRWLSNTQAMAPGSTMYLEMDDPAQRRSIVAFLQSVSRQGAPVNQ